MARCAILLAALLGAASACTPSRDFHGYLIDEAAPAEVEPGVDTRASVLAELGSPSTKSVFDDNTWIYMTSVQERFAFLTPRVADRTIVAISFGEDDLVDEVLTYDRADGRVIEYVARETPTRGRELGLLEQIFGTVGSVVLPQTDEATPSNPTGRR